MGKIYLIYGENTELIEQKKNEIISKANIDDFNTSIFDMEETPLNVALSDALSVPFLSDMRLVVFKNAFYFVTTPKITAKKTDDLLGNKTDLENFLKNHPDTTISIFTCPYPKLDSKKTVVKIIKEEAEVIECPLYSEGDITRWVNNRIKESGHKIRNDASYELFQRIKGDGLNFKNEVEKLLLYKGNDEWITLEDVQSLVIRDPEDDAFKLLNAIIAHKRKDALEIYYDLRTSNDSSSLLGLIERKFQEILYTKELLKEGATVEDVMNTFSVSNGRAYYMIKNAKEVNSNTVRVWLKRCQKLDYERFTGRQDEDAGLELLLLKV